MPPTRKRNSCRLFYLNGVELRAHWSTAVYPLLIGWYYFTQTDAGCYFCWKLLQFSDGRIQNLPQTLAEYGEISQAILLTILLHEIAHAVAFRLIGYPLACVMIYPMFGLVRSGSLEKMTHLNLLVVGVAGPLINIIVGLGMLLFPPNSEWSRLGFFCCVNLITGLVNMLPIFPFDGGRVLFAILCLLRISTRNSLCIAFVTSVAAITAIPFIDGKFTYLAVEAGVAFIGCVLWGVHKTITSSS